MTSCAMPNCQVLVVGTKKMLCRPCVDCGLFTGIYCDHCEAAHRCPRGAWAAGQMTPLCSFCNKKHRSCHFCRGLDCCVPPPKGTKPQAEAGEEDIDEAGLTAEGVAGERQDEVKEAASEVAHRMAEANAASKQAIVYRRNKKPRA